MSPSPLLRVSLILCFVSSAYSSKILAVFPTVSKSHFDFFQPLLLALASRGHDVTVVNSHPQPRPVGNYTDIDLADFKKVFFNSINFDLLPRVPSTFFDTIRFLHSQIEDNEPMFSHPDIVRLLESRENFDLVITELWNSDLFLAFAHKFKAPIVAMSSSSLVPWGYDRFGNPDNPSYISNVFLSKFGKLDFFQRLVNTFEVVTSKLLYKVFYNTQSERIARKVFGDTLPPLEDLAMKTSLLLVNTHHTLHGSTPLTPQVVQVGGIHIMEPKTLQTDIDRWMNESIGVVYFSFGSMLRGATLPADKVRAFIEVFRSIPQRVLWKWEDDSLEGLPDNVKLMKWLPQRDILAHPKVRVFISHGGLLGTTEAVVSGVPILGIPMYGDQPNNVAALVENKVAIHIDYNNISVSSISYALNQLLTDLSYAKNARILSQRFLDRPQSPLDTAVYWTEYVIRHRGAPHLQSAAVHLTWYQYYLLDVAAFCLAALAATLVAVLYLIKISLRLLLCFEKQKKVKSS